MMQKSARALLLSQLLYLHGFTQAPAMLSLLQEIITGCCVLSQEKASWASVNSFAAEHEQYAKESRTIIVNDGRAKPGDQASPQTRSCKGPAAIPLQESGVRVLY